MLRGAGREHARRARAVDKDLLCRALAAAGGQHERAGVIARDAVAADGDDREAGRRFLHARDERERICIYIEFFYKIDISFAIFGASELFTEANKSEAVVNALFENTAEPCLSFDNGNLSAFEARALRRGKTGRSSAYNHYVVSSHITYPLSCCRKRLRFLRHP